MKKLSLLSIFCILFYMQSFAQALHLVKNDQQSYHAIAEDHSVLKREIGSKFQQAESINQMDFSTADKSFSNKSGLNSQLAYFELLDVDMTSLNTVFSEAPELLKVHFNYKGQSYTLDLQQNNFFDIDYVDLTDESASNETGSDLYYQGIIEGEEDGMAAMTISDNGVNIWMTTPEYSLEVQSNPSLGSDHLVIFNPEDILDKMSFECSSDKLAEYQEALENSSSIEDVSSKDSWLAKCVTLGIESDYAMYRRFGSTSATNSYMRTLFNYMNTIFKSYNIVLSFYRSYIHTRQDAYRAGSGAGVALGIFRQYHRVSGCDMHLLLSSLSGGGGVAYLGAVNSAYSYAVVTGAGGYNTLSRYCWTLSASIHELGHTTGSPHTHDCAWNGNNTPLDGCGPRAGYPGSGSCSRSYYLPRPGSVMSYCHLISSAGSSYYFWYQPGKRILNLVNQRVNRLCWNNTSGCVYSHESNDNFSSAARVYLNSYYYAAIYDRSDLDYYVFSKSTAGPIQLTFNNPSGMRYEVLLYNSSRQYLGKISTSSGSIYTSFLSNRSLPAGTYYILVQDIGRNQSSTNCYNFRLRSTSGITIPSKGEDQPSEVSSNNKFSIVPNPAVDQISLVSETYNGTIDMTISDLSGRQVQHMEGIELNNDLDVSKLDPGIYMINLKYEGGETLLRFVKE